MAKEAVENSTTPSDRSKSVHREERYARNLNYKERCRTSSPTAILGDVGVRYDQPRDAFREKHDRERRSESERFEGGQCGREQGISRRSPERERFPGGRQLDRNHSQKKARTIGDGRCSKQLSHRGRHREASKITRGNASNRSVQEIRSGTYDIHGGRGVGSLDVLNLARDNEIRETVTCSSSRSASKSRSM